MIPLILIIVVSRGVPATPQSFAVDVAFKNNSSTSVKLLKYFDDEDNLPIWFQIHMTSLDGTPVPGIRGGGKISLRGPLDYVLLAPGEKFSLRLEVAKFVSDLQPGSYKISVTYRNQYGEDCFRGELNSNVLEVNITSNKP
jgi:hypothetical protein